MIKTINKLIEVSNERKDGYQEAADNVEDPVIADIFRHYANQSESFVNNLIGHSNQQSSSEVVEPTISDVFTTWMEYKSTIMGGGTEAMLGACEIGEAHAIQAYEEVLENELSDEIRDIITSQLIAMKNAYEHMAELKQEMK